MSHKLGSFYNKIHKSLVQHYKEKEGMKTLISNRCFNFLFQHFLKIPSKNFNISTLHNRRAAVKQYHVSMRREQQFLCKLNLPLVQNTILNTMLLTICGFT